MKAISIILISIGILSGLFGVRTYLRDDAYAKGSVVVKASVKSAEVKPNPWKNVGSIRLLLTYMRDGVVDSLAHNYSEVYSNNDPLPTIAELKAASPHVRYVPNKNRSEKIPDWVTVSNTEEYDGSYGWPAFNRMIIFIVMGLLVRLLAGRRQK